MDKSKKRKPVQKSPEELIAKARELAEAGLVAGISPGPYATDGEIIWGRHQWDEKRYIAKCNTDQARPGDAFLLAASWEMAQLLRELANTLESVTKRWKDLQNTYARLAVDLLEEVIDDCKKDPALNEHFAPLLNKLAAAWWIALSKAESKAIEE